MGSSDSDSHSGRTGSGIPAAAVGRLSLYLRELRRLQTQDIARVSSTQLGERLGVTGAIVRRDLASLGQLGQRGVGYDVLGLLQRIREALGADQIWNVVLVGTGSLGTALLNYKGFSEQGFHLLAAFDKRSERLGQNVSGIPVLPMERLEAEIERRGVHLAILAVPADAAQETAQRLSKAGIAGILNFAPVSLSIPGETCIANVDLANELQQLSFAVGRRTTFE